MPYIIVKIQEGAGAERKRELLRRLTETTVSCLGVSPKVVRVVIEEAPKENWAYAGMTWEEWRSEDGRQIPFLIVRFTEGFPGEKKEALVAGLSKAAAEALGTDLSLVKGVFEEVPLDAWANGGILLSAVKKSGNRSA